MTMRNILRFLALCLVCVMMLSCKDAKQQSMTMSLVSAIGDVTIARGASITPLMTGQPVEAGDVITTGKSSMADISFGNTGVIRVQEHSKLTISSYLLDALRQEGRLSLRSGRVFVTLGKLSKNSSFDVTTPTFVASVRGTSFRVSADTTSSRVDVLAGSVRLNPVKDGSVVAAIETVVEKNNTITIDLKNLDALIAKKAELKPMALTPAERTQIQKEAAKLRPAAGSDETLRKEIEGITPPADIKPAIGADDKKHAQSAATDRTRTDAIAREAAERAQREKADQEKRERELQEQKKQETKEKRVKNIPNL